MISRRLGAPWVEGVDGLVEQEGRSRTMSPACMEWGFPHQMAGALGQQDMDLVEAVKC